MKKKFFWLFLLMLLILFVGVSCSSTPKGTNNNIAESGGDESGGGGSGDDGSDDTGSGLADPDLAAPNQASLANLDAANQRADKARELISDFDGPEYFPQDWGNAETLYNRAQTEKKTATVKDVRDSTALYNSAADAYEAMTENTTARYAQDLEDEVIAARNEAIREGAQRLAPEYLLGTDNVVFEALDQYEAKDYYAARDTGLLMRDAYNTMAVGLHAYKIRMEIEDMDLYPYDPLVFDATDDIALSALDDYVARDIATASAKADFVSSRYEQSFARAAGVAASLERSMALDLRADVATREEYKAANEEFVKGASAYLDGDFEMAAEYYVQARILFFKTLEITQEKRREAEMAIRAAELKMVESDEAAHRAELMIGGGI